jgi:hypothetical protein
MDYWSLFHYECALSKLISMCSEMYLNGYYYKGIKHEEIWPMYLMYFTLNVIL